MSSSEFKICVIEFIDDKDRVEVERVDSSDIEIDLPYSARIFYTMSDNEQIRTLE